MANGAISRSLLSSHVLLEAVKEKPRFGWKIPQPNIRSSLLTNDAFPDSQIREEHGDGGVKSRLG